MSDEIDAFHQLVFEHKRTLFMFYGHRMANGNPGGGYFKLANSLSEALADLEANPGVADDGGYLVRDAFIEASEGDEPVVHVELVSLAEILAGGSEGGEA
jgi:hypothetical protein